MDDIGPYKGQVGEGFKDPELLRALAALPDLLDGGEVLASNKHLVVALSVGSRQLVVKRFGSEPRWKDRVDSMRGSAAFRSWIGAQHLRAHGVGTPKPVAILEKRASKRLLDSYLVTERIEVTVSFKDALLHLYQEDPSCEKFMNLLDVVAAGVWDLHGSGFQHRDLGNQNILLTPDGDGYWKDPSFIDLNRGRIFKSLSQKARGRDLSRIALPSDLMRAFLDKYCSVVPSRSLVRSERFHRRWYDMHHRTRRVRHPIREATRVRKGARAYPSPKEAWIWDERSAQAIGVLSARDRHRFYPPFRSLRIAGATLAALPDVWRSYRQLLAFSYSEPVSMANRVGVSIDPTAGHVDHELELLSELGALPVLVRVYHHESMESRRVRLRTIRDVHEKGHRVCLALVQDRAAVRNPDAWKVFCESVLSEIGDCVEIVELGHAVNRVKWGVWSPDDVGPLLAVASRLREEHPHLRITGPACIDFEYPFVIAALGQISGGERLGALSHHLYVDRRGAPENKQGRFSLLEKCALARAVARWSDACDDALIISEVNWPLQGQGVYSPVGSPYVAPGVRENDPSVSEDDYANYMLRYLCIAIASGLVERVYWWRLVARGFGLVDDTREVWRKRLAFEMLKVFLGKASGPGCRVSRVAGQDKRSSLVRYRFEDDAGEDFELAYSPNGEVAAETAFPGAGFEDAVGTPLDATGLKIGERPVYVHRST